MVRLSATQKLTSQTMFHNATSVQANPECSPFLEEPLSACKCQPLLCAVEACLSSKQDVIQSFIHLFKTYLPLESGTYCPSSFLCKGLMWHSVYQKNRRADVVCISLQDV